MSTSRTTHDERQIYCRRLGHPLTFRYCRTTVHDRPCTGVANCWFERFDVVAFLRENCPEPVLETLESPPRPKMVTLLELVERARQAQRP